MTDLKTIIKCLHCSTANDSECDDYCPYMKKSTVNGVDWTVCDSDTLYADAAEMLERADKTINAMLTEGYGSICQFCKHDENKEARCTHIDGSRSWCCENAR